MTSHIAQLTYAIGDIHGYDDLFEHMLGRVRADAERLGERPRIVLLGDYVDRGPASRQVVERIRLLLTETWCDVVALMGNHEDVMLSFLTKPEAGKYWCTWGGDTTLASYGVSVPAEREGADWPALSRQFAAAIDPAHLAMLHAMPAWFLAEDYLFVHAGVDPDRPLSEQDAETFMYMRGRFLKADQSCEYTVVHGHSPHREPVNTRWRIGIDTGIYYTGILTAIRLRGEDRAIIQVRKDLNPNRPPPTFF